MVSDKKIDQKNRYPKQNLMHPTPINTVLRVKTEGFVNLVDALEYAAEGDSGFNFYDHRGELDAVLSYRDLRDEAKLLARRLLGLGCKRGDRVGIIAETDPMFHRFFFACVLLHVTSTPAPGD